MAFEYRVSLQHVRSWAVGEPRRTRAGTNLQGVYGETYCAFDVGQGDDGELARCLSKAVTDLAGAKPLFHDLRETGGAINFYIIWTAGERGEVFDTTLLSSIAQLGIDLGIEPLSAA